MNNKKKFALIVAGGSGSRMQNSVPKQFMVIAGKPVLMYSIEAFHQYSAEVKIVLVLAEKDVLQWQDLCEQYQFTTPFILVTGGDSRFQSVKNGLSKVDAEGLVAIHDGARPLVTPHVISRSFSAAVKNGNAVAAVNLKDSLRMIAKNESRAVDRAVFRIVQTPQVFQAALIKAAYAEAKEPLNFTDDASVAEHFGQKIYLVQGSNENMKITTQEDLCLAETILLNRAKNKPYQNNQ